MALIVLIQRVSTNEHCDLILNQEPVNNPVTNILRNTGLISLMEDFRVAVIHPDALLFKNEGIHQLMGR